MSKVTDNGEFWLPNDFLNDEDIRMTGSKLKRDIYGSTQHFPTAFDSFRNSPFESLFSSTETESDEEESLEWLNRKISSSSLQDDLWAFRHENIKKRDCMEKLSRSGFSGIPKCAAPVAPPPLVDRSDAAWDILYEAAKDLARMRLLEEAHGLYENRGLRNHGHGFNTLKRQNSDFGAGFNEYKQLQLAQMQQHQQMMKQQQQQQHQQQENGIWGRNDKTGGVYPNNHQTRQVIQNRMPIPDRNNPVLHQIKPNQPLPQSGSGMRAVFLGGNTGPKRECAGTGVFLPRQAGSPADTRKKPGCSTVLLPDRVVQALNLNLEAMEMKTHNQSRPNMSIPAHYGGYRGDVLVNQKGSSSSSNSVTGKTTVNQEISLPQEWIY
ncbi:uncharacterized protein LOC124914574 isoform X2 [Impatiens glandulifera]|uniref:uncharacterized protein LOC124914574 isoform X2 n=1 Tax=Impatiens glandulifera TaxID=253017 RepID=UPI001FB114EE|nr:uncharacterized protein LOC124914574 isoform X2 [Impatiens glandulifera]